MKLSTFTPLVFLTAPLLAADAALRDAVAQKVAADYPALDAIYKDLHAHPELSLMEQRSAGVVARELRAAGYEVTEKSAAMASWGF